MDSKNEIYFLNFNSISSGWTIKITNFAFIRSWLIYTKSFAKRRASKLASEWWPSFQLKKGLCCHSLTHTHTHTHNINLNFCRRHYRRRRRRDWRNKLHFHRYIIRILWTIRRNDLIRSWCVSNTRTLHVQRLLIVEFIHFLLPSLSRPMLGYVIAHAKAIIHLIIYLPFFSIVPLLRRWFLWHFFFFSCPCCESTTKC